MSRRPALAFCFALLAACAVGPDYSTPELTLRPQFLEADTPAKSPRNASWWLALEDATLQALIHDASAGSFDLRVAAARVEEARALRIVARADLFPSVDGTASATRQRNSENSLFFAGGGFPAWNNQFQTGLESSWEIDLWGRVRRQVEAATADQAAFEELLLDVQRVVIAQVAGEYVELRGAQRELEVTRQNLAAQRRTMELTQQLAEAGLGNQADVARASGQLHETESFIPLLEGRVSGSLHRLAVLTGGEATTIQQLLAATTKLPDTPATPPLGIPSDLLQSRPDIRAAERELAAATARIGVATADLYPQVSLTGRFGVESTETHTLFEPDSISFGVGPALRWPLLNFGRVRAQIRAAGARQHAALARYEQVVAQAISEVETALAALRSRLQNRASLAAAVAENQRSLQLVEARFRAGAVSFLEVLDAQRRVLLVEAALARAQTLLLQDFVTLNRALG